MIREFEKVIDTGYQVLPIFEYPTDVALYGLLAAFDSHIYTQMLVRERSNWAPLSIGQTQLFKTLGEGLVWGLRWLLEGHEAVDVRPQASESLLADAHQLIEYGAKYYSVANMYSAFSQGRMDASVNVGAKTVRFDHKPHVPETSPTWGFYDDVSNEVLRQTPAYERRLAKHRSRARALFRRARHHFDGGHVVLDDVSVLRSDVVREYVQFVCTSEFGFPPDQDLGGYTVQDFTAFWHTIYAWSTCVTELYLRFTETATRQEECMATQVVPRAAFLDALTESSGLTANVANRILAQLRYDKRTTKPDIFLQPLVCGENLVAWSAMVIQLSRFQRNLLKLMARTPSQKSLADRVIGGRERSLLLAIKDWLEHKGWSITINRKIPGNEGEVDLLGVNWRFPSEILVVEAKALLQVDDLNEIRSATKEMQNAQQQIQKIVRLLSRMPDKDRSRLFPNVEWDKARHWYGIVVTPETEPGMEFDHSTIPAAAFTTLRQRLNRKDWISPSRIWNAMVNREWQSPVREATFSHEQIELAGITFEVPQIMFNDE